jgi:hypothetical protein
VEGFTPHSRADPEWDLFAVQRSVHHAVLLTITSTRSDLEAIDTEQNVFDRFSISKGNDEKPVFHLLAGDANGSGFVTLSEAITIVQYLFLGRRDVCSAASDLGGRKL